MHAVASASAHIFTVMPPMPTAQHPALAPAITSRILLASDPAVLALPCISQPWRCSSQAGQPTSRCALAFASLSAASVTLMAGNIPYYGMPPVSHGKCAVDRLLAAVPMCTLESAKRRSGSMTCSCYTMPPRPMSTSQPRSRESASQRSFVCSACCRKCHATCCFMSMRDVSDIVRRPLQYIHRCSCTCVSRSTHSHFQERWLTRCCQ